MGISEVQEGIQQGNVYMIKRYKNTDTDRNKKQDYTHRETGLGFDSI